MASSVAPAPASNIETLLPRPPTPPREAGREGDGLVKSILSRAPPSDPQDSLQTPPAANTPTSTDAPDSKLMSSRTRKKVVWSAHTEYKDPVDYRSIDKSYKSSPLSVPSPASRPIKGILKPSSSPNRLALSSSGDFDAASGQPNIIEMLDSTIKQLAGSDRDSKLDAYMMLSRALKASNNLPDRVALQDKMSLFMQFIQRDITSKSSIGSPDSSLINHALTLLATFLHFPAIASTLTSDFGVFVIDHSIRAFEDTNTPKDVARHLMQVVAFQNFSAKVMTSDRVGRLVAAMYQIEDHLTGKSIVMSRIHIYRRLVKQSSLHMVAHSNWLKNVLADMLSSVKDIRAQAISLATEAGFALRSEKQLMRKASEIFQTTNEGQAYIQFYIQRLQEMLKDRSSASAMPQIWSAIILYMRCPLERWQYYGPWLTLVQSAFNTTDFLTKQEANFAWNRYIYLTLADSKVTPKNLGTLCQPLLSQLRRRANPKQLEEAVRLQRIVIGGVCNLYYYAFAPGNVKFPPESIWDVAVQPVLSQLINLDGKPEIPGDCLMQAGRILTNLVDVATPRIWRQDRIMETPPAKPDELPPLDSKWVRRNCDKIFQTVGPLLEKRFLDLANKDSLVFRLWHALVGSIAAASAKDIKVSEDTAKFFAHALGLLSKMWLAGIPEADTSHGPAFLSSIKNFIEVLVKAQGMLPFTEKRLAMTMGNSFEPIATPSQNQGRKSSLGTVRTPLQHLFCLLSSVPLGGADDEALSEFFLSVFEPFFLGKATKARLELSNELLQLLPRASPSPYGPWILAAQNFSISLEDGEATASLIGSGKMLGQKYRDITCLLERGLFAHPWLPLDQWFALFERLSENVVQQLGDAGRALAVIEPLAKVLLDRLDSSVEKPSATSLKAMRSLFDVAKLPRDKTALNTARQRLWGASMVAARAGSSDPFDNLYKLGNQALETFYGKFSMFDSENDIVPLVESIRGFLVRCFSQSGVRAFTTVQAGLCMWVEDDKSCYEHDEESLLSKTLIHIWDGISKDLAGRKQLTKDEFDEIEPLLTSAFKSKLPTIVDKAVELWNVLAKDEEKLDCSDSLKSVASNAGSKKQSAEAKGYGKVGGAFGAQASSAKGQADETNLVVLSSNSSHQVGSASPSKPPTRMSTRKRRLEETPEPGRTKPTKRTSTPRLRHDNSQIQFTLVASSSPNLEDGSQHLTERQKEVRERQRETEAIYSDLRTSSPGPAKESSPILDEKAASTDKQAGETTPRQATSSYDNLISSTPTPRRGKLLIMDDNDPPSSPLVPRPYPLLSEIKSRSMAGSSLDTWEFSSPPGSPDRSDQEVLSDVQLPGETPTKGSTKKNTASLRDVIPSSLGEEESSSSDLTDLSDRNISSSPDPPPRLLETPTKKRLVREAGRVEDSPKSVDDDEFVDARSSPEKPSLVLANDTSFALSEGDETRMMKLAEELESGDRAGPQEERNTEDDSDERPSEETAEARAASPPMTRGAVKRSPSAAIPPTPSESTGNGEGGSKRKRKRGGSRQSNSRSKKQKSEQKSENVEATQEGERIVANEKEIPETPTVGVETRGSARRHTEQRQQEDKTPRSQKRSSKRNKKARSEETDDEVMSQLVNESEAVAESQKSNNSAEEEAPAADMAENEPQAKILTIMETLQTSLAHLRDVALPRSEVYKMEDMLMDLKRELFEAERRGRDSN
ncbi:Rap1-interacting factor 1 N terminal domain-containing protein [Trichoderma austrokoningii]